MKTMESDPRRPAQGAAGSDARPREMIVSIINYRTADMTIACIESVLAHTGGLDLAVAVIDNRSDDGSAEAIEAWIARQPPGLPVRLVRSATNSGFSGGHNQGFATGPAESYLVLNSDALVRDGALPARLAALRSDPAVGLVAPRLEDPDGTPQRSCFRCPSPLSEVIRGAEISLVTRVLGRWDISLPQDPPPESIGWVSFACVLLRGSMVGTLGPMDEGYFMYCEDIDYCLSARRAGWRIRYLPKARVVHLRGGSAPVKQLAAARRRLPSYFYASRTRYFRRAFGPMGPAAANLGWSAGYVLRHLKLLAGTVPTRIEREPADLWINFLDPLGDRRAPER